jgi:hypothetical protein
MAVFFFCSACSHQSGSDVGVEAEAQIAHVPAGVGCLEITVTAGSATVDDKFNVASGGPTSFQLTDLPVGSATFTGFAYGPACANLPAKPQPSWVSAPVTTTLTIGQAAIVALELEQPAGAAVGVGFAPGRFDFLAGASSPGFADGVGGAAKLNRPMGVISDGAGNLYVADNHALRKVVIATGAVSTVLNAPTVVQPYGLATDGQRAFMTDLGKCSVSMYSLSSGDVDVIAGGSGCTTSVDGWAQNATFGTPVAVAFVPPDSLYVAEYTQRAVIRKIAISTQQVTTFAGGATRGFLDGVGTAARFMQPAGLVYDGSGSLYVTDATTVRKVDIATATVTTLAGQGGQTGSSDGTGASARFSYALGITIDSSGRLYVSDYNQFTVRRIVPSTAAVTTVLGIPAEALTVFGPLPAELNAPAAVAALPNGDLAVLDNDFIGIARGL